MTCLSCFFNFTQLDPGVRSSVRDSQNTSRTEAREKQKTVIQQSRSTIGAIHMSLVGVPRSHIHSRALGRATPHHTTPDSSVTGSPHRCYTCSALLSVFIFKSTVTGPSRLDRPVHSLPPRRLSTRRTRRSRTAPARQRLRPRRHAWRTPTCPEDQGLGRCRGSSVMVMRKLTILGVQGVRRLL